MTMRTVRIFTYHNANLLDVSGPAQVFASASQYAVRLGVAPSPSYRVELVSRDGGPVTSSADVALETSRFSPEPVDTFLIAGGHGADAARADLSTLALIRQQAALSRRVGSICTGAFLLAQAGLLDGRKATTHWGFCDVMAREFPQLRVIADVVYVVDGSIWTSAGVLAGVDMTMAMVESDLGRRMADYTARALVTAQRRTLGAPQISPQLAAQETEIGRIRQLMEWISTNPRADLSTSALADRAALSTRSLHRHFRREAQATPAAFVERTRIDTAQRLLMRTDRSPDRVASAAGFGSLAAMRRAFVRVLSVTPTQYRKEWKR